MIPLLLLLPRPVVRRRVARRPIPYAGALLGGAGNDTFNFGTIGGGGIGPAGPPGPPGPQGPQGLPGNPSPVAVTIVVATPYTALSTDYLMDVNVAAPVNIILPASVTGTVYIVKDISGNAATNNIIITASTLIDGAPSATINTNYGSLTFIFNGTEWTIV